MIAPKNTLHVTTTITANGTAHENVAHHNQMSQKLHVAVIGAGPAGLSACQHLLANYKQFSFVCFEQQADVGGAWLPRPQAPEGAEGAQQEQQNLRANLPIKLLTLPTFPWSAKMIKELKITDTKQIPWHFPTHSDVANYLRAFVDHFQLRPYIQCNEKVESVRLLLTSPAPPPSSVPSPTSVTWATSAEASSTADPDTEGAAAAAPPVADKYVVCTRNTTAACGTEIVEHTFDAVIVCTGNNNSKNTDGCNDSTESYFPFLLSSSSGGADSLALSCTDNRLQPLYKHIVHVHHPMSLFFIGLNCVVTPGWLLLDLQVQYVVALLKREFALPTQQEMLAWENEDIQQRHNTQCDQGGTARLAQPYYTELVRESGARSAFLQGKDEKETFELFERLSEQIQKNPNNFRDNFRAKFESGEVAAGNGQTNY